MPKLDLHQSNVMRIVRVQRPVPPRLRDCQLYLYAHVTCVLVRRVLGDSLDCLSRSVINGGRQS